MGKTGKMVERTVQDVHRAVRVRYMHGALTSEAVAFECGNEIVAAAEKRTFLALGDLHLLGTREVESVATTGWVLENKVLVDLTLYGSAVSKQFVLNDVKKWNSATITYTARTSRGQPDIVAELTGPTGF